MTGSADRLEAAWRRALGERAPYASWSVTENGGVLCEHEPERWFSSASMIKTFLAALALDEGGLSPGTHLRVRERHRTGGDGVLGTFEAEVELPLRELLRLMLAISDNTATNVVLEALGGAAAVNERLAAWGYGSRICGPVGGRGARWDGAEALHTDLPTPIGLGMTSVAEHQRLLGEHPAVLALAGRAAGPRDAGPLRGARRGVRAQDRRDRRRAPRRGLLRASGRELLVGCFTDGGAHEEWADHPAAVGMGLAMAWTAELLGLDVQPPPGVPPCPV